MATYNLTTGRAYYGPALGDPTSSPPMWTNKPATPFYEEQHPTSGLVTASAIGAGVFASGFLPARGGNRMWDNYIKAFRAVEEYSPGAVLRTFQLSALGSQFTNQANNLGRVGADIFQNNAKYAEYLTTLIGEQSRSGAITYNKLLREGVELRGGQLFFGGGELALPYASAYISPEAASQHIGSAYSRSMGGPGGNLRNWVPKVDGYNFQIIGSQSRLGYAGRNLGAVGTEFVSRFNRLLEAPFEMEPFRSVFGGAQSFLEKNFGTRLQLAVAEGPGMRMMKDLAVKYGLKAGAIGLAYSTADYLVRNADMFEGTGLDEGITAGVATGLVQANLAAAEVAQATGLQSYREMQESIAPGSTSLQKLLAFPLMGALGTGLAAFGVKTYRQAQYNLDGFDAAASRVKALEDMKKFTSEGRFGAFAKQISKDTGLYARQDRLGSLIRKIAKPVGEEGDLAYKFIGKLGPTKLVSLIGAGLGAAAVLPFLPGALIPEETPEELRAIYSGEQEIAVRKGRWWEFGRSPYEGGRISYFRPHWYPRMLARGRDKSLYGEEEPSPLEKWWKTEFTYDFEKEHYRDRPYPITSLPFEDVPFIGPLLANTIGRLIKPPKLMHTEEWLSDQGVKAKAPGFGARIATELGERPGGVPISPYSAEGAIGEQAYRLTEMIGLPGFAMTSIKSALTGTPDLFDQVEQLESARRAFGIERAYWDMEIGGGLGTTEALRRLYPHRRRQVPLYNPIRNTMPDWLPGPGEKGPDFLHGDPYTKVKEGEIRLPGKGYEARFPELEGMRPEDYPLIHRLRILGDVAPYTDQYKETLIQVKQARKTKEWTEYEEKMYATTMEQVKQRKVRKEFEEYEYLTPGGEILGDSTYYGAAGESEGLMATLNSMKAVEQEGEKPGVVNKFFGGYWELLSHNAETAFDQLTPVSPGAKLVHMRTAIEDYERTQAYGTESAFWDKPLKNFLVPFANLVSNNLGFDSIPDELKSKRGFEEYFDVLEYVKNARLSNMARAAGDREAQKEFEAKKDETLFGVNPFTFNYTSIYRSLPRSERDYFKSFSEADTTEERARILELVPENEKALYIARWKLALRDDLKAAQKAGLLSEKQEEEADAIISGIYEEAGTEGFPSNKELMAEYFATKLDGENYADWYRRTKLLAAYNLPSADWVGWHPSVDLEDIKLKVIQQQGEDMHDYDLWPSRAQALVNKPYIDQAAIAPIIEPEQLSESEMQGRIQQLLVPHGARAQVFARRSGSNSTIVELEQEPDLDGAVAGFLNG